MEFDQNKEMSKTEKGLHNLHVDPTKGDWLRLPTVTGRYLRKNSLSLTDDVVATEKRTTWEKGKDIQEDNYKTVSLFRNMNDAVAFCEIIYNSEGSPIDFKFRDMNNQYELIAGCNRKKLLGKTAKEHFQKERIPHLEKFSRVASTGIPVEFDTYLKQLDSYFNVQVFSPRKGEFATVLRDISKRVDVENKLQVSKKLNKTVNDLAPVGIAYIDPFGEFQNANKEFLNIFETGDIDCVLKELKTLCKLPISKVQKNNISIIEQILAGKIVRYDDVEIESASGTKHINVLGAPTRGIGNKIIGGVLICLDITRSKHLHHQFLHAQKVEAVGRLALGVVHDYNNLLTIITANTEMVMSSLDSKDPLQTPLKQIEKASSSSRDLTRQLLTFSRKKDTKPETVEINSVLSHMDLLLRRIIGEDIDMLTIPGEKLNSVLIDPSKLDQVILNLAINARDAMPDGGKLTIETKNLHLDGESSQMHANVEPGNYVMMIISDTGHGMPPEIKEHAFDPFFTTKGDGKGTGLGLSTVYEIVEQSNGQIRTYSKEYQGTVFKIYFPAIGHKTEHNNNKSRKNDLLKGKESILIVENEDTLRKTLRKILRSYGYQVYTASSGEQALEVTNSIKKPVELLITDLVMPGIGGSILANRLVKRWKDMKTLYMSGYSSNVIVHREMIDNTSPYLHKPFGIRKLTDTIRNILDSRINS